MFFDLISACILYRLIYIYNFLDTLTSQYFLRNISTLSFRYLFPVPGCVFLIRIYRILGLAGLT